MPKNLLRIEPSLVDWSLAVAIKNVVVVDFSAPRAIPMRFT
jgi:hypothetical protein